MSIAIVVVDMIPGCFNEPGRVRDAAELRTQIAAIQRLVAVPKPVFLIECGIYNGKYGPTLPEISSVAYQPTVLLKKCQSAFYGTDLDDRLSAKGAHTIVLAGVNTSWCIRSTAVHARDLGYEVITSRDLVSDFEWEDPTKKRNKDSGLSYLRENTHFFDTVDQVLERMI